MEGNKSWIIFNYEVMMFQSIRRYKRLIKFKNQKLQKTVDYALTESLILHIRILTDIILTHKHNNDDITLNNILPGFNSENIEVLRKLYGSRNAVNSPHWRFNKLLAHATIERSEAHNYTDAVELLAPILESLINEINEFKILPNNAVHWTPDRLT